jgi:hypothetical protein
LKIISLEKYFTLTGPVYYQCKDILLGEGGYGKVFKGFAVTGKKTIQPVSWNLETIKSV